MSADPNKKSPRSFQCRDVLWETFEQMARELECSIDYLINESMKQYARQRSYSPQNQPGGRPPYPSQPGGPPGGASPPPGMGHPAPPFGGNGGGPQAGYGPPPGAMMHDPNAYLQSVENGAPVAQLQPGRHRQRSAPAPVPGAAASPI